MPLDLSHYAIGDHPIDTRAHLDRALTKLYRIEDIDRIGPLYYALIEEAADELEQAGHAELAADLREGEPVRRVTDAVREALRIGEGEKLMGEDLCRKCKKREVERIDDWVSDYCGYCNDGFIEQSNRRREWDYYHPGERIGEGEK